MKGLRRKHQIQRYLQVFAVLLLTLSIPKTTTTSLQRVAIAALAPAFEQLKLIQESLQNLSEGTTQETAENQKEIDQLKLENQLLSNEVSLLKELLQQETLLDKEVATFEENDLLHHLKKLRKESFQHLTAMQLLSIPARVLFHSPTEWSNALWINVGDAHNQKLGKNVIQKNSPVVVGIDVIGVIDYVGAYQSRVLLITSPKMTPAVRAMRTVNKESLLLAKGILRGNKNEVSWRKQHAVLYGEGFNYDFADQEGEARDLRTGDIGTSQQTKTPPPIIEIDDLLITTGMDGVFPPGLRVAKVSKLYPLKEGDYTYTLEATPTAKNLSHLSQVSILPPIRSERELFIHP